MCIRDSPEGQHAARGTGVADVADMGTAVRNTGDGRGILQEFADDLEVAVVVVLERVVAVSYTHLRAHETVLDLVCRLLLEKKY